MASVTKTGRIAGSTMGRVTSATPCATLRGTIWYLVLDTVRLVRFYEAAPGDRLLEFAPVGSFVLARGAWSEDDAFDAESLHRVGPAVGAEGFA